MSQTVRTALRDALLVATAATLLALWPEPVHSGGAPSAARSEHRPLQGATALVQTPPAQPSR